MDRRTSKIGDYTTRIVVQTRSLASQDSLGEEVESWTDGVPVWCKREWLSSSESNEDGGKRNSGKRARFTIHGRPTVAMVDQIKIKATGEEFGIDSILTNDFETIIEGSA